MDLRIGALRIFGAGVMTGLSAVGAVIESQNAEKNPFVFIVLVAAILGWTFVAARENRA